MMFLDNAAPDSCCAEHPLHVPTHPRLVFTAATVREKTWEQTNTQTDRPTTITHRLSHGFCLGCHNISIACDLCVGGEAMSDGNDQLQG